jgi:hypothetical protein
VFRLLDLAAEIVVVGLESLIRSNAAVSSRSDLEPGRSKQRTFRFQLNRFGARVEKEGDKKTPCDIAASRSERKKTKQFGPILLQKSKIGGVENRRESRRNEKALFNGIVARLGKPLVM